MAGEVDILNLACIMLGVSTVPSLSDGSVQAKAISAVWNITRDSELRANIWKFAKRRVTLPALSTTPADGPYNAQFALPADYLRILMVSDCWPSVDLTDYRTGPTSDNWSIEGNLILTNLGAPLPITYIARVTDATQYDATFKTMFAAKLAQRVAFKLQTSTPLMQAAAAEYVSAKKDALRSGAMENPPVMTADDSWVMARMEM